MINIMIVEDDVFFRRKLLSMLDWRSLDLNICGECSNGKEALRQFRDCVPDIIITDISMPQMNGIELIKAVKDQYPSVTCLVLSSYDDFAYVKDAMKLGADDYVLKHSLPDEMDNFLSILEEAKEKAEGSENGFSSDEALKRRLLVNAYMGRILHGNVIDSVEIDRQLKRYMVYFPFNRYAVAVIKARDAFVLTDIEKEQKVFWNAENADFNSFQEFMNSLYTQGASERFVFMTGDGEGVCILNMKTIFSKSRMQSSVRDIFKPLLASGKLSVSIGVSDFIDSLEGLVDGYRLAEKTARNGLMYPDMSILFSGFDEDFMCDRNEYQKRFVSLAEEIITFLKQGDNESLKKSLSTLCNRIYESRLSSGLITHLCDQLSNQLENLCWIYGIPVQSITCHRCIPGDLILLSASKEVIYNYLWECSRLIVSFLEISLIPENLHIKNAIQYIHSHYYKMMGLQDTAEALGLSEHYLSNLFKQETGMRFVEYLNEVRLQHAKQLLSDGSLKVYEIADKCGFQSTAYFCRFFKEKTGMSFTSHRRSILANLNKSKNIEKAMFDQRSSET